MIIIDVSIGIDGIPSEKTILLGNKYENNDTIVNFDLPADFNTYKKYIITVNRNTTRIFPLTDDRLVVSSALTELAGNWAMYLMCRESTIDLSVDNPDISAKENEHVFISDGFIGTVADIQIDRRLVESIPMDTNLKIAYDDLMDLKAELLARIDGIDEYYTKTDTNTNDIAQNSDMIQRIKTDMESKVDKIEGKGLSTNDFTNEEKEKLSSLSNYDDSQIKGDIGDLNQKIVQETTNRTNADNALQEKINTNKNDISILKGDLANKLPKFPTNWEAWTSEEQAAARERMGIDKPFELIETIKIDTDDVGTVMLDVTPGGAPYNFESMLVRITTFGTNMSGNIRAVFAHITGAQKFDSMYTAILNGASFNDMYMFCEKHNGLWIASNILSHTNGIARNCYAQPDLLNMDKKTITGVRIYFSLSNFIVGTEIKIYGVRA